MQFVLLQCNNLFIEVCNVRHTFRKTLLSRAHFSRYQIYGPEVDVTLNFVVKLTV